MPVPVLVLVLALAPTTSCDCSDGGSNSGIDRCGATHHPPNLPPPLPPSLALLLAWRSALVLALLLVPTPHLRSASPSSSSSLSLLARRWLRRLVWLLLLSASVPGAAAASACKASDSRWNSGGSVYTNAQLALARHV